MQETREVFEQQRGQRLNISVRKRVQKLITVFEDAVKNKAWDSYWDLKELIVIATSGEKNSDADYITDKKKKDTETALRYAKRHLKREHNVLIQHVPGKGHRLWPQFEDLTNREMRLSTQEDALAVLERWTRFTGTLFGEDGICKMMRERGQLSIAGEAEDLIKYAIDQLEQMLEKRAK